VKKIKKKSYVSTEKTSPSIVDRLKQEFILNEPVSESLEAEIIANRSEEEDWELIRKIHDQVIMELIKGGNKN
jgi:hypothetical protein